MRSLILALILIASWTTPARAQAPTAVQKILVMKLRGDAELVQRIVQAYAGVIGDHPGYQAVTAFDVADLLGKAAEGQEGLFEEGCEQESCWQLAADAVGDAQFVIGGSVGTVGKELVVSLSLIDSENLRPVGSAVETAVDADDAVMAGPTILARLFGWEGAEKPGYTLPEGKKISIAALDLKAADMDEKAVASLSQVLAGALKDIDGVSVITQDDIRSMLELEAQKQALGCTDVACFAEVGGALGVDKMVVGHVTNLSGRYVVSLRLIDARSSEVNARVTEAYKGEAGQLVAAVRFAGRRLLGVTLKDPGTMAVSSTEQDASVYVNEEERGDLPMPSIADLAPGLYRVRVAKGGYDDWMSEVYVEPNGTTAVWAPLTEQPPSFYETWWFWTGVGAVVVGTATFLVVNAMSLPDTTLGNVEVR